MTSVRPASNTENGLAVAPAGKMQGVVLERVTRYLGVPYATASRFAEPRPLRAWRGVRLFDKHGPACPQNDRPGFDSPRAARALAILGMSATEPNQADDCLVLNLWVPDNISGAPVMVWLHGSVDMGSGGEPWCDGESFAREHGVVVVTINSRLSAFGHFGGAEHANNGLLDVIAALQWLVTNVSSFGGNPENITLGGVSAGAFRAACVAACPLASGLIKRLILHSLVAARPMTTDECDERTQRLVAGLEGGRPEAEEVSGRTLARHVTAAGAPFLPVLDELLPSDPIDALATGHLSHIPTVVGTTRDEGFTFVPGKQIDYDGVEDACRVKLGEGGAEFFKSFRETSPTLAPFELASELLGAVLFHRAFFRLAEGRRGAGAVGSTYGYEFCAATNLVDGRPRTPHGFDVPFAFGNLDRVSIARGLRSNWAISKTMGRRWAAFTRGQAPDDEALNWPAYSDERSCMILGPTPTASVSRNYRAAVRDLVLACRLDATALLA